jgi:cell volume regulation protein A
VLRGSTLRRRLARALEGEAGSNDPVAVLLVIGFIEWITTPGYGVPDMLVLFAQQLLLGAASGLLVGFGAVAVLKRATLGSAGLYPVASVATVGLAFGSAAVVGGSGFLAVYLAGLVLGSFQTPARQTLVTFHDGLAWVAQLALFFALGLLVFPGELLDFAWEGVLLAVILTFVARPIAVLLVPGFDLRERAVLAWAGLRGAVPVVLATFPVIAGLPGSAEFFNIVFFAVLISTLLQGPTFEPLAERLGMTTQESALPAPLADPTTTRRLGAEVIEFRVRPGDAVVGRVVRELQLPREALLNVIIRDDQAIPPRGSSRIEAGDRLHVLVRQEVAVAFRELLGLWREGPLAAPRPPRRPLRTTIFSTRPWRSADGDAARPEAVEGVAVVDQVRTRRDRPGAVVALEDGRVAFTGPVMAVGPTVAVQGAARRRLGHARDEADRAWWREVIGALATP